jgi:hypothetical protein
MITNACGTQAILNLLLNLDPEASAKHGITLGEEIKNFKEFTQFLPPDVSWEEFSVLLSSVVTFRSTDPSLSFDICLFRCAVRLSPTPISFGRHTMDSPGELSCSSSLLELSAL